MKFGKFIIVFLVVFYIQDSNAISFKSALKSLKELFELSKNGKFKTNLKNGTIVTYEVMVGTFEKMFSPKLTQATELIGRILKRITTCKDVVTSFTIDTVDKITNSSTALFEKVQIATKSIMSLDTINSICNTQGPDWLRTINGYKNDICGKPITLTKIFNEIMTKLRNFKAEGEKNVIEFATKFHGTIKEMSGKLQSSNFTKEVLSTNATKDFQELKETIKDFAQEISKLGEAKISIILSDAGAIIEQTDNLIINIDEKKLSHKADKALKELLAEIRIICQGVGSIATRIVSSALAVIETISDACNRAYSFIKNFISDMPSNLFDGEDEDDENLGQLKDIAQFGTSIILDYLVLLAESAVKTGIQFVEKVINTKKEIACDLINAKIKAVQKVKVFTCDLLYHTPVAPDNLYEQLVAAETNLNKDINYIKELIKDKKTSKSIRPILEAILLDFEKNDVNYQKFKKDQAWNMVNSIAVSLKSLILAKNKNKYAKRLVDTMSEQFKKSASRCKFNDLKFNNNKIKNEISFKKCYTIQSCDQLKETIKTNLKEKAAKIVAGKNDFATCLKNKKEFASKKFQQLTNVF